MPDFSYYGAAKAGLGNASECARLDLGNRGIDVLTVYLGLSAHRRTRRPRPAYSQGVRTRRCPGDLPGRVRHGQPCRQSGGHQLAHGVYVATPASITRVFNMPASTTETLDVAILGTGISGIGAGIRRCCANSRNSALHICAGRSRTPVCARNSPPDYTFACKRVLMANDYYPALNKTNVDVLATGVRQIRGNIMAGADGSEREVDTIILGTGFHVTEQPVAQRVFDNAGRSLSESGTRSAPCVAKVLSASRLTVTRSAASTNVCSRRCRARSGIPAAAPVITWIPMASTASVFSGAHWPCSACSSASI